MRALSSIWSQYAKRLFDRRWASNPQRSVRRRRSPLNQPSFSAAEVLEDRKLLSAAPVFGSALSVGNDTSPSSTSIVAVATDNSGNRYVTGGFTGTVDFDPSATHAGDTDLLTARGSGDVFVAKYAADNSLVWVQRMGGDAVGLGFTDVGRSITIDANGNVYVSGDYRGSSDFGSTTLSSAGDANGFVAKLDAAGTVQWAKSWGTTDTDFGASVSVDSAGSVYTLGYHSPTTTTSYDYDILKFNSNGTAVWSKAIAAHTTQIYGGLAVDGSDNVIVGGSFRGTVDFDPGPKTHNVYSGNTSYRSGFILELNSSGNFKWVSPFVSRDNSASSAVTSVAVDGSGNVIAGGLYAGGNTDFNPGSGVTTLPAQGGFITKVNNSGGLVWAQSLGSDSIVLVMSLAVDNAGAIYATGTFYGTTDFDPGAGTATVTTAGGADIFVLKLSSTGTFGWAATFGGTGTDYGYGIAVDSTGSVYVAGAYNGTVDFDPDPLATYNLTGGYRSGFLLKLNQS